VGITISTMFIVPPVSGTSVTLSMVAYAEMPSTRIPSRRLRRK
jgi:hypothetical protein